MKTTILSDVDGVILDWENAFHNWMTDAAPALTLGDKFQKGVHRMYGIKSDEAMDYVRTFNQSAAIGFLEPLRDAVEGLVYLHQKGYHFHFITSLGYDPFAQQLRIQNIKDIVGFDWDFDITFLDTASTKETVLEEMGRLYPGALWVEDNTYNADVGLDNGLDSVIIRHPYNAGYAGDAKIVHNWAEIINYIEEV
jgi:phosphoglycolate phosphatase-like HAD superfamily hydrolase